MRTGLELWNSRASRRIVSFGCPILDNTSGGLIVSGITEISGSAGSGKSQLCMSTSVQCCYSELLHNSYESSIKSSDSECFAAYITCGEGEFPIRRLQQMAQSAVSPSDQYSAGSGNPPSKQVSTNDILSKILIQTCFNIDDVMNSILDSIPKLCRRSNVRLLVIDSIAGALQSEYETGNAADMTARTNLLFRLATQLRWLADTFSLAVVVVNQFRNTGLDKGVSKSSPALGLAWSHCVNTSIILSKLDTLTVREIQQDELLDVDLDNNENIHSLGNKLEDSNNRKSIPVRIFKLERSPWKPCKTCYFQVTQTGVMGLR